MTLKVRSAISLEIETDNLTRTLSALSVQHGNDIHVSLVMVGGELANINKTKVLNFIQIIHRFKDAEQTSSCNNESRDL